MKERYTSRTPTACQSAINLNVDDDFKLVYQFTDSRFSPPILIPLDSFDLQIDYYIKGKPEHYVAVMKRGVCVNCVAIPETSTLKVIFDNHNLKTGNLYAKFTFSFPDPDFPDRYGDVVKIEYTNIVLTDNIY